MTKMKPFVLMAGAIASAVAIGATAVWAAGDGPKIDRQAWSFAGPGGRFNQAQLQRGFQVYEKVCSTCHGLSRVAFRNLAERGGPAFPEDGVRALAASWPNQVREANEAGETAVVARNSKGQISGFKYVSRPPRLSDKIPGPYKNEAEARSIHNGAYPPDLSLIAKGRSISYHGSVLYHPISMLRDVAVGYQEGGADYLYALLTGYKEAAPAYRRDGGKLVPVADKDVRDEKAVMRCVSVEKGEAGKGDTCVPLSDGMHYNAAFPGSQIAMAQPIRDGDVKYSDGSPATVQQYAADVSAFLQWASDPSHDDRKRMGWQVLLYLLITSILLYVAKKRIWRDAH
jgi:ubiquinol-cytochrome c reductase cytochrome c1 subunit